MTVGTHIAEILRQGVWASLTGGWYYEPAHSTLCNTVHLYLWIVLLVLPILLGLISTGVFSAYLVFSYSLLIIILFTGVKLLVSYLHRVFDTTEPIVLTKNKELQSEVISETQSRSREDASSVLRSRSRENAIEMVEMMDLRQTSHGSPMPVSRASRGLSHPSFDGRRRAQRVRIDTQETDIHQVDVDVHVETDTEPTAAVSFDFGEDNEEEKPTGGAVVEVVEEGDLNEEDLSKHGSSSSDDVTARQFQRKYSEPAMDAARWEQSERRNSEGTARMRRANSSVDGRRGSEKSKSGGMLSQNTLDQCRQNTRKSYPMKISSTDEFLNNATLKRTEQRGASSSVSIGAADESTANSKVITDPLTEHIEVDEDDLDDGREDTVAVDRSIDSEKVEGEEEETEDQPCMPSSSNSEGSNEQKDEKTNPTPSSSAAWSPVVVSFATELDRPSTSSLHRAKDRMYQEDLPGTSDGTDLKGEITKFLEDLIDKHPETLDAIESVRQSRLGRGSSGVRNVHVAHPHVARWSGSRRASQGTAMTALSDLALRDGTHVAQGHEDTTQGAVHSFQDEDGNWWTYAFDENGHGTAQVLGSGRALMELLQSAPVAAPPNKLEVLPESAYASSEDEEVELEGGGGSVLSTVQSTQDRERGTRGIPPTRCTSRSRAASSSSNDSQVYIATTPSAVFHAPTSAVATRTNQMGRVQPQMVSLVNAAARLRAVLQGSSDEERERGGSGGERGGGRVGERSHLEREHREHQHGLFELEQRLRLLRMDSTGSSHSSRFRFLADLGLTTPSLTHAPTISIDPTAFGVPRRPSSAKKAYYYRLKVLPKSNKSFKLKMDRLSVGALFDRNRSLLSGVCDVILAMIVSLLAALVISQGIYYDISLVAFAFVVAGAHFSLLKSVQPDAASPIHGFNWLVAYSRPIYFSLLSLLLLWLNSVANDPNNEKTSWNWNLYRASSTSWDSVLLSLRDLLSTAILFLPIAFTFGWLPQINTLVLHILEQIEMHIFGGTACISVTSAIMQVFKSVSVWGILSLALHFAHQNDSESTQTVLFSVFCSVTVTLSFILSRLPSNPHLCLLSLSPFRCLFSSSNSAHNESDTSSEHSGARLLCTAKPKQQVQETTSDDWPHPSSPSLSLSDPLPAQLRATLSLRTRHDLLFSFIVTLLVFALHCSSLFTATKPYFTIVITCVTIFTGCCNHYLYMQLRVHNPWKIIAKPVFRSHEFGQFESPNQARLMWFEMVHVWMGALERNVLYPLVAVSLVTEYGWKVPYPVLLLPLIAMRILRGGFSAPQMMFVPLALSFLLTRIDWHNHTPFELPEGTTSADLFPVVFYLFSLVYPKWMEFYLKLSFVLAYVAPWQISWGSAFHAFAQPFSVPHSSLVFLQTVVSSVLSAPLNPFLGSSFFTTSYVRPVKFWERDYNTKRSDASNTRLASQIDRGPMMECTPNMQTKPLEIACDANFERGCRQKLNEEQVCFRFWGKLELLRLRIPELLVEIERKTEDISRITITMVWIHWTGNEQALFVWNEGDVDVPRVVPKKNLTNDSNLNAVFYEHLTRSLQSSLAGDIRLGRWATSVQPGDCFILASFYLNCLVHIIEVGNGFVTFQLRGLEFRGTYCHQREVEAISEDTTEGAGCCCCSPGSLPGLLSLNTAWTLRWLAWEVTASKYIIEGYSITDNSAVNLLQVHELRRLLVTLYVKCIIYFTLKSEKLNNWLANETILHALEPIETNPRYVDVDHMFCSANDEDYDVNNMGVSRQSFSDLYLPWINFCAERRAESDCQDPLPPSSPVLSLCLALSLLGRRALGAASYNRHSNAAESFLYGLHALFKGDFRVTCQRDEWVFADMDLLRCVIAPSVRMALKLHQDHFAASDDFDHAHCMFSLIENHEENLFISHEHDPGWRKAILSNTPSLLALRHIYDDGQDDYKIIMLNKMHLNMRVIKLNRECVRAFWAGQQQELIFLRNRNPERGSIQNARQVLRNMINSSADQPVGYPIYVSPLTTSFVETHSQIRDIQGPPLTLDGIVDVLSRAWSGLRSHFGTSGSSSLGPASCGAMSNAATAGSQAPPPSSVPSIRPTLDGGGRDSTEQDRLSNSSSQPEQSVVSMSADGSARVLLCRVRAESTPPAHRRVQLAVGRNSVPTMAQRDMDQPSTSKADPGDKQIERVDDAVFVEINDVEQIFKCLDEPLKATGEPLVVWPKESWRSVGGRSAWDWMPVEGWMGQIVHSWYPNHPQRALRSHIGGTIHLVSLFDMPSALVPIGDKGVRIVSREDVEAIRGRITPPCLPDSQPATLQDTLTNIGAGAAFAGAPPSRTS